MQLLNSLSTRIRAEKHESTISLWSPPMFVTDAEEEKKNTWGCLMMTTSWISADFFFKDTSRVLFFLSSLCSEPASWSKGSFWRIFFEGQLKSRHFTVFAHVLSISQISQVSIVGVNFAKFLFFKTPPPRPHHSPNRLTDWFFFRWHCNSLIQQSVYLMVCGLLTALY